VNWVDLTIIGIIAVSTIISLLRGFVREAMSLVTWILAAWLAFVFADDVGAIFGNYIQKESWQVIVGFLLIFITILIVGGLANYLLSGVVSKTGLSSTDRIVGIVFGFVRGVFLVSVLVLLANLSSIQKDDWWTESHLVSNFQGIAKWLEEFIPDQVNVLIKNQQRKSADKFSSET